MLSPDSVRIELYERKQARIPRRITLCGEPFRIHPLLPKAEVQMPKGL